MGASPPPVLTSVDIGAQPCWGKPPAWLPIYDQASITRSVSIPNKLLSTRAVKPSHSCVGIEGAFLVWGWGGWASPHWSILLEPWGGCQEQNQTVLGWQYLPHHPSLSPVCLLNNDRQPDDILLLCSDGLWEMVRDQEIAAIVTTPIPTPTDTAHVLIQAALAGGREDKVSAIVAQVSNRAV